MTALQFPGGNVDVMGWLDSHAGPTPTSRVCATLQCDCDRCLKATETPCGAILMTDSRDTDIEELTQADEVTALESAPADPVREARAHAAAELRACLGSLESLPDGFREWHWHVAAAERQLRLALEKMGQP